MHELHICDCSTSFGPKVVTQTLLGQYLIAKLNIKNHLFFLAGEEPEGPDWCMGAGSWQGFSGERTEISGLRAAAVESAPWGEGEGETWKSMQFYIYIFFIIKTDIFPIIWLFLKLFLDIM